MITMIINLVSATGGGFTPSNLVHPPLTCCNSFFPNGIGARGGGSNGWFRATPSGVGLEGVCIGAQRNASHFAPRGTFLYSTAAVESLGRRIPIVARWNGPPFDAFRRTPYIFTSDSRD